MSKFGPLFNDSVKLFETKQFKVALESFRTLLSLLQEERRKDEDMISQTLGYIEKMEPTEKAHSVSPKTDPALQKRSNQYLDDLEQKASQHFSANEFQLAASVYHALAEIIQKYHPKKKSYLAETYWNEAMSHNALFCILEKENPERALQHKEKVKSLVELARDTYPKNSLQSIAACNSFLSAISPVPVAKLNSTAERARSEQIGKEVDQAFAAIQAIGLKQLPLESQYDIALRHIEKALQLLASKQNLSPADKDHHFYCTSVRKQIYHYFNTFGKTLDADKENAIFEPKQDLLVQWKDKKANEHNKNKEPNGSKPSLTRKLR